MIFFLLLTLIAQSVCTDSCTDLYGGIAYGIDSYTKQAYFTGFDSINASIPEICRIYMQNIDVDWVNILFYKSDFDSEHVVAKAPSVKPLQAEINSRINSLKRDLHLHGSFRSVNLRDQCENVEAAIIFGFNRTGDIITSNLTGTIADTICYTWKLPAVVTVGVRFTLMK